MVGPWKFRPDLARKKEEIEKLKNVAIAATNPELKKATMDSMAAYGKLAASAISDVVVNVGSDEDVKKHGLGLIKTIRG
jgi:hypothetical protein